MSSDLLVVNLASSCIDSGRGASDRETDREEEEEEEGDEEEDVPSWSISSVEDR